MIAVTFDTVVYSWGDNGHGQLGHGDTEFRKDPTRIESLKGRNIHRYFGTLGVDIYVHNNQ